MACSRGSPPTPPTRPPGSSRSTSTRSTRSRPRSAGAATSLPARERPSPPLDYLHGFAVRPDDVAMSVDVAALPAAAEAILDDVVAIRRRLHRRPEIGLDLPVTQQVIVEELERLGLVPRLGRK